MAGRAPHIAGIRAQGRTLTVRLLQPEPDMPTRLSLPFFCAVPRETPLDPRGVRVIPGAGPYHVAAFTPAQGVVLVRNPYYRGNRPHHVRRIVFSPGITPERQVADVSSGRADVALDVPRAAFSRFPVNPGDRTAGAHLSVHTFPELDFIVLNTHRRLFADTRLRRAVNFAIDRTALARIGTPFSPTRGEPTDQYLPPGLPGFNDVRIYPSRPDVAKARALAGGRTGTAVLYTCDQAPCGRMAQVITSDLAAIGIRVETKTFSLRALFTRLARKGEPFDLAWIGWIADYPDPDDFLNLLLESGRFIPSFDNALWKRKLAHAASLSGPDRYLTYGRLDAELARTAAPWVAFDSRPTVVLLSRRVGCEVYQPVYGIDLTAMCLR